MLRRYELTDEQFDLIQDLLPANGKRGGQWNDQYDFVRLHQPYAMFTAGDQKWRLPGRDRTYLATRREVLDHLHTVPERSAAPSPTHDVHAQLQCIGGRPSAHRRGR